MPLALSNTFGYQAAEVRFALEDSEHIADAVNVVRTAFANKWIKNPEMLPTIEELA